MSEEIKNENVKNEDRMADIFEKYFDQAKMARRRFEMIVYPAILGMFILAGVGYMVLFYSFSALVNKINVSSANCAHQKAGFSQNIVAKDQKASLYRLKDH